MKKICILFLLINISILSLFCEEIKLVVVEQKGIIDIKTLDEKWFIPKRNDIISYGTEIITGFHSQISLEIEEKSYITVNQLSKVKIENIITTENDITININLISGYIVIHAKSLNAKKINIFVNINKSNVEFTNASGEIYLREDKGAIIKAFTGRLKIGSKLAKIYFLRKNEVCGISTGNVLIESDYFLRRNINAKSNTLYEKQLSDAYYDFLFLPYTQDFTVPDYQDNFRP